MCVLTGPEIIERKCVTGHDSEAVQPASVDLRIDLEEVLIPVDPELFKPPYIVTGRAEDYFWVKKWEEWWVGWPEPDTILLAPGAFMLAVTKEIVDIPLDLVGRIEGKSTWGRRGLLVVCTAGWIDPGYIGRPTLELKNLRDVPIHIKPGEFIAQLSVMKLTKETFSYDGRYQNAKGPEAPK